MSHNVQQIRLFRAELKIEFCDAKTYVTEITQIYHGINRRLCSAYLNSFELDVYILCLRCILIFDRCKEIAGYFV